MFVKISAFLCFCIFFLGLSYAHPVELEGYIHGLESGKRVDIFDFYNSKVLADTTLDDKGFFKMSFDVPEGIYRLRYGTEKEDEVDIIIEKNTTKLHFSVQTQSSIRYVNFTDSGINKSWQDYYYQKKKKYFSIELISYFMRYYNSRTNDLYKEAQTQRDKDIVSYQKMTENFVQEHPNTLVGIYVSGLPKRWFPKDMDQGDLEVRMEQIRNYWGQNILTDNLSLTHTPYYYDVVNIYLDFFYNSFSVRDAIPKLKAAVDILMHKFSTSTAVQKQIVDALIIKLNRSSVLDEVLQYLDEKYVDATLVSGDQLIQHTRRMASYKEFQKGKLTPNIRFMDQNKKERDLKDIDAKYTLLVFWNSKCTHCMEQMPKLNAFLKTHSDYKALAISSDMDASSYQKFIPQLSEMYHYCDFKGYESKVFQEYYIDGTPTVFVLDKDKKLIEKKGSIHRFLKKVGV